MNALGRACSIVLQAGQSASFFTQAHLFLSGRDPPQCPKCAAFSIAAGLESPMRFERRQNKPPRSRLMTRTAALRKARSQHRIVFRIGPLQTNHFRFSDCIMDRDGEALQTDRQTDSYNRDWDPRPSLRYSFAFPPPSLVSPGLHRTSMSCV